MSLKVDWNYLSLKTNHLYNISWSEQKDENNMAPIGVRNSFLGVEG